MDLQPALRSSAVTAAKYCYFNRVRHAIGGSQVTVVCVGRETCLPFYRVSAVDSPYTALEFVTAGRGCVRSSEGQRELLPGTFVSYTMNEAPELWTESGGTMTKYFATYLLEGPGTEDAVSIVRPGRGLHLRHSPDLATFQSLFEGMIDEGLRGSEVSTTIAHKFLDLIVFKADHASTENGGRDSAAAQNYEAACACVETNYLEIRGLSDLSQRLSLDSTYLCKLFRRFGDETPHQYVMRHKLNHAAELLLRETLPIKRVAEVVGIDDAFYFSRLFRNRFGSSPSQFREEFRRPSIDTNDGS